MAARYHKLGLLWEPDWHKVKGTYLDLFGRHAGSVHGSTPAIYSLAISTDMQESFIAASTDDEVREFFLIMSSGSEGEKESASKDACDKALRSLVVEQQALSHEERQ